MIKAFLQKNSAEDSKTLDINYRDKTDSYSWEVLDEEILRQDIPFLKNSAVESSAIDKEMTEFVNQGISHIPGQLKPGEEQKRNIVFVRYRDKEPDFTEKRVGLDFYYFHCRFNVWSYWIRQGVSGNYSLKAVYGKLPKGVAEKRSGFYVWSQA